MVRAVIWDVGGTLVDHAIPPSQWTKWIVRSAGLSFEQLDPDAVRRAEAAFAASQNLWRTLEEEQKALHRISAMMLEGTGAGEKTVARLAERLAKYYDLYRPVEGIVDLLQEVADLGPDQGVVSNWGPSLPLFLEHHGLARYFSTIVVSAAEGIEKPDPRLLQIGLDRLGVAPEEAIYLGNDPDRDKPPADELGVPFLHFDPRREHASSDAEEVDALRKLLLPRLRSRSVS